MAALPTRMGATGGDFREARFETFEGGGGVIKALIPAIFALVLSGCVAWQVNVSIERVLTEQEAKYEARIAEVVHAAVASRDKEITQLFNWYVELRRDLYTEWAKGIKPIKDLGGKR
jgi:hypothetical protein